MASLGGTAKARIVKVRYLGVIGVIDSPVVEAAAHAVPGASRREAVRPPMRGLAGAWSNAWSRLPPTLRHRHQ
jgi:hypothetical protein